MHRPANIKNNNSNIRDNNDNDSWLTFVYCNGVVEVRFCDGLVMTLSTCGNYTTILDRSKSSSNHKPIKQMTRYMTTQYQTKIRYLIKIRNQYTPYPLCWISQSKHQEVRKLNYTVCHSMNTSNQNYTLNHTS